MKIVDVIFREDLYPRIKHDWDAVDRYIDSIDQLPPIEVNQHNELIDGWHRWTAHKKCGLDEIAVIVTQTASESEFIRLAIERNRAHGLQMSQADKEQWTVKLYLSEPSNQGAERHRELSKLFSVGVRTVRRWVDDIDKKYREWKKSTAREMWLACYTQQEIADRVEAGQKTVNDWIIGYFSDFGQLANSAKTLANYAEPDWSPPLYNVWTQAKMDEGIKHFGNVPATFVDRLVYLYTNPLDVVVDPFAGSGSTIDICRKRFRRYWVSDRLPIERRVSEIRCWDVSEGLPPVHNWKDVKLVYLDPPYWKQAEGAYSKDAEDMANMGLQEFTDTLVKLIKGLASKLTDAYIALIIQPTQWRAPDRAFTDHIADLLRAVKLPIETRIQAPYSTQQCNAQMVDWAKENKKLLTLSREIIVWK